MLFLLRKIPWHSLIKFAIIGGGALAIDMAIYFILTRYVEIPYLIGRSISLGVAIVWNFTLNRYWTFHAADGKIEKQAIRFLIVLGSTSILSLGLMRIGVSILHFYDLLVIISVSILIMLVNFCAHYFWSYKN